MLLQQLDNTPIASLANQYPKGKSEVIGYQLKVTTLQKIYKLYIYNLGEDINCMVIIFVTEKHLSLHIILLQCFNCQVIFVGFTVCWFFFKLFKNIIKRIIFYNKLKFMYLQLFPTQYEPHSNAQASLGCFPFELWLE